MDWAKRTELGSTSPAARERAATLLKELTGPQPFIITSQAESNTLPAQYAAGAFINLANVNGLSIYYPKESNSVTFDDYVSNRLFSFTAGSRWPDFLAAQLGLPSGTLRQPPGPLQSLTGLKHVFVPLTMK